MVILECYGIGQLTAANIKNKNKLEGLSKKMVDLGMKKAKIANIGEHQKLDQVLLQHKRLVFIMRISCTRYSLNLNSQAQLHFVHNHNNCDVCCTITSKHCILINTI